MKPDAVFCVVVHLEVPHCGVREVDSSRNENAEVNITGTSDLLRSRDGLGQTAKR